MLDYQIGPDNLKTITKKTLRKIAPKALRSNVDKEELDVLWIMTAPPVKQEDDEDGYETWSETNEPELAEYVASAWDELAISVGGQQVVVFCGTWDDEYGNVWNNSSGEWENYNY
jgi:hypothetical protein